VPICEAEHWSLAIICNLNLVQQVMNEHIEKVKSGYYQQQVDFHRAQFQAEREVRREKRRERNERVEEQKVIKA